MSPAASLPLASAAPRFAFLDGLRALGALGVAALHIHDYGPLHTPAMSVLPEWIRVVLDHGWMGVQVFFVISGFVIAHSLRNTRLTPAAGGEFVLRRFLRLSPPYWVTMAVVSLLMLIPFAWHRDDSMAVAPTAPQLLLHVFYLQNLVGLDNISTGFWMLCIEMQFYLLYALMLGLAQAVSKQPDTTQGGVDRKSWLAFFWLPGLVLLFFYQPAPHLEGWVDDLPVEAEAVVPYYLGVIAFGIVTYAALEGWLPKWSFWVYAAAIALRLVVEWMVYQIAGKALSVALLAGVSIYLAGRTGGMSRWLNVAPLQWLGRISYSFFLIHYAVSFVVKTIGYRATGSDPWWAVAWMVASLTASFPAAWVMYRFVEEPAMKWSRRFGRKAVPVTLGTRAPNG